MTFSDSTSENTLPRKMSHVLVVDDDPEIVESLRYAITQFGCEVSVARDGNQALAHVASKTPDLIVLDLMMPRRSGFLVLEQLCQTTEKPIPVIVITANEGTRHREYAKMLGAADYISKPFVMERLLESIAAQLESHQSQQ
jgi:DNA-binding response OmpR family regulator